MDSKETGKSEVQKSATGSARGGDSYTAGSHDRPGKSTRGVELESVGDIDDRQIDAVTLDGLTRSIASLS